MNDLTNAFGQLLGLRGHALPIQPVKRAGMAFQVMDDVGMPTKGHAFFADKLVMKHAIGAIAYDLRHVQIVHRSNFLSIKATG